MADAPGRPSHASTSNEVAEEGRGGRVERVPDYDLAAMGFGSGGAPAPLLCLVLHWGWVGPTSPRSICVCLEPARARFHCRLRPLLNPPPMRRRPRRVPQSVKSTRQDAAKTEEERPSVSVGNAPSTAGEWLSQLSTLPVRLSATDVQRLSESERRIALP